jgi:rhodanese-related sulfurtransferase
MSFFTALFGLNSQQNSAIQVLSSQEFRAQTENKKVQLIDTRTPNEYKSGHLKGAKNIDFFSGNFNLEFNKLSKQKAVYLYCRSGSRSRQSANKLAAMGFEEIYDLKGGVLRYH